MGLSFFWEFENFKQITLARIDHKLAPGLTQLVNLILKTFLRKSKVNSSFLDNSLGCELELDFNQQWERVTSFILFSLEPMSLYVNASVNVVHVDAPTDDFLMQGNELHVNAHVSADVALCIVAFLPSKRFDPP